MNSKIIGRNIQKARLIQGLSQEEFAHLLGVAGSFVGKIEAGAVDLTLSKIQEIAGILHIDIESLTQF